MRILITGGAGFIGRWVTKKLLENGHKVWVLDDLSNGSMDNIAEFRQKFDFNFVQGDIKDNSLVKSLFAHNFSICFHLGASINVQDSIDDPLTTFANDTIGTFNILEQCRLHGTKIVFMSSCMVYDRAYDDSGINEQHSVKPASPYAGAKIAAESMVLSYYYAYSHPVVVLRPFNTYGPFQKTGGEGGVVAIFINKKLDGKKLLIYGDGTQTRDLLYVEDCADFVVKAGFMEEADGQIINAGLGEDISINNLAMLIAQDKKQIEHVPHIHPQSEIQKLKCNFAKAELLLNWKPQVGLEEGIKRTESWIKSKR